MGGAAHGWHFSGFEAAAQNFALRKVVEGRPQWSRGGVVRENYSRRRRVPVFTNSVEIGDVFVWAGRPAGGDFRGFEAAALANGCAKEGGRDVLVSESRETFRN